MKGNTSGATHSKRYFCSCRGMLAMALKSAGRAPGFTTSPLVPWQFSHRASIQSVSSWRSSIGMRLLPGALPSSLGPQVGTCSVSNRSRKLSSSTACLVASSALGLESRPGLSNTLRMFCARTPLRRTSSSTKSPRTLVLMSRPKRPSNLSKVSTTPSSKGIAEVKSRSSSGSLAFAQKTMKLPKVRRTASRSGQSTSHWSASMVSGMSVTTSGMYLSNRRKCCGPQKSGCDPAKSS
mmetsp:Transcript_87102/g.282028  ORF Transcript_87102/g.282028 Transcript_87102/m.282028 type:complete len:237 (+) Transcript_87102:1501-2211(+)